MARTGGSAATGEQPERVVETPGDLIDGEHPRTRSGEFDYQGHPVEPPTDVCHGRSGLGVDTFGQ